MKNCFVLALLVLLASCGKTVKTTKSTSYSMSGLQASGIYVTSYYQGTLSVLCSSGSSSIVTNQDRINELTAFRNTIGVDSSKSLSYTYGSITLTPLQMNTLLSSAILRLQQSANLNSTYCPAQAELARSN
jgi:hypothetical protein